MGVMARWRRRGGAVRSCAEGCFRGGVLVRGWPGVRGTWRGVLVEVRDIGYSKAIDGGQAVELLGAQPSAHGAGLRWPSVVYSRRAGCSATLCDAAQ